MRIGVISEGHADRAVITNILCGLTGIDSSDIEALRPIDKFDETDKKTIDPKRFGGWSAVKEECESRKLIDEFLSIEGQDYIVIHIDSAEAQDYGIKKSNDKNEAYCETLREQIIQEVKNWLNKEYRNEILYAVAIEEIDAWVLTIYEDLHSCHLPRPKERLSRILSKEEIDSTSNYDNYLVISKPLSKKKEIQKKKCLERNCSLNAFFEEVKQKILTSIEKE